MRQAVHVFIACGVAFCVMVFVLFSGKHRESQEGEASDNTQIVWEFNKTVRDVTPDDVVQLPQMGQEPMERLPAVKPPPPPPRPPKPDRWTRPVVLDGGSLQSGNQLINLADIRPVKLERMCEDHQGKQWRCGRHAKANLARFVRTRTMDCDPRKGEAEILTTRCRIADQDLSKWLVRNGWAEPLQGMFQKEYIEAKRGERGIWRSLRP